MLAEENDSIISYKNMENLEEEKNAVERVLVFIQPAAKCFIGLTSVI